MIRAAAVRQAHLRRSGARGLDAIEDARADFRDATRAADDRAFVLTVTDAVGARFDPARFQARLDQYRAAGGRRLEADPVQVVEATARRLTLTEGEKSSVLQHLLRGGDLSAWGLANAVTRTAEGVPDDDRATELEAAGGRVIELAPADWRAIAA
jgi:hypothetical protein